jgi:hypothetical protein
VKRKVVLVWLVAVLLVVVALWHTQSRRSTDLVRLGVVVDGGIEEHPPRLATAIEALGEGTCIVRRGAVVEMGGHPVEPIQRPRVRAVRRTARGPPG